MLKAAGHVGVWAGLYAVAAFAFILEIGGITERGHDAGRRACAAAAVLLLTAGAYALDRVKLRTVWIDPADALAQPERYAFLRTHAAAVRIGALLAIVAGAGAGLVVSRWAPLAGVVTFTGVVIYAPGPRARAKRLKDRLWLKNGYVAAGMTGLATLAALAVASPLDGPQAWLGAAREHAPALACACLLLGARVWLDAAISDIDDEAADRISRTGTLPTSIGGPRTWRLTGLLRAAVIAGTFLCTPCPLHPRLAWGLAAVAGFIALRWVRPEKLRDAIDLRFPAEAAAAVVGVLLLR